MAILVLSSPLPPQPFIDALRALAPGIPVWSEADDPPADRVEALLAWRLKPGTVPRYPRLRVLCSVGAGAEKLLVDDLPEHVTVTRVVDPLQAQEIAQFVLACTLRFTRELPLYEQQQSRAEWLRHPVRPASRCRVGLLGLGAVGQAVARAFAPLGYEVAAWVRRERARDLPGVNVLSGPEGLPLLLARSDILVCTLPRSAEARALDLASPARARHAARRRAGEHRDGGAAMPGRAAAGARRPAAAARDRPPRRLLRKIT